MGKLELDVELKSPVEKIISLASDYENYTHYLPDQIKSIKILSKENNEIITEETLVFSTVIKNEIKQECIHKLVDVNTLYTEIISGPAKGTRITSSYETIPNGTRVKTSVDLQLNLKAKFLQPIIKKAYKSIIKGILYKMDNEASEGTKK